ncbi:MAG TPA: c-type cytochrome [Methylomirabilota bacterium]|nr:c-type cytochrome [Methylomirabilota bacterium]
MTRRSWTGGLAAGLIVLVAVASALLSRAGAAPPSEPRETASKEAPPREIVSGRQLFVTHCVACHGDAGHGDGPSATGLATKPANLADGRLMNGLPDTFLVNIILHGGAAEGLAPTMPPFVPYLGEAQAHDLVAYVRTLADPPLKPADARALVTVPGAPRQPIFFSHLIHAGSFKIDCQYCHVDARRSEYAGLPSVERCLGCHKIIGVQDNPEIGKIHEFARNAQPIPWVRVFKVPEFTHFPHKAHIRAELACQTCHGPIERMRVVGSPTGPRLLNDLARLVGMKPSPPPLTMGWCVDCHRQQNATRKMQAPLDCVVCHH